jgi:hypothetical protein
MKYIAEEHKTEYDEVVFDTVNKNMYVDDCLVSLDSVGKARLFVKDMYSLCMKGGFHLTKWISNSMELLDAIPKDDQVNVVKNWLKGEDTLTERALGVHWFVEDDPLGFLIQVKNKPAT